ncbi:MAG: hypothetical protein GY757_08875, partial [bacterium]|nr:hypothetical protein [bacterium]
MIIFGLSVWFVVDGVNEYKGSLAKDSEFRELQVDDFGIFRNYHEYSVVGLKSKMGQTPMTFLRNGENSISGLSAKFNTATILEVSKNYKGKGMFEDESYSFFSNIGLILYAVSLLLMFFGFETVRHKHYIKLLDSMSGKSKIFVHAVLPNAVLLALTLFALFTAMYSIVTVLGITLSGNELVNFLKLYLVTTLKLCFFYFLGVVVGSKSSKGNKVLPIMLLWLIFVFLIPGLVNYIVKKRADRISSDYLLAIEKLTVVKDFEKNAVKKAGKFDKTKMDVERNLVEGFYSQDAKRVYELEVALRKEMVAVTDTSFKLSLLIPTTFFKATWRETSGLGYQNVLNYYKFVQDMQRQFLRFFIDRLYYNDPKVLVNFIKKDENIYYAQSLSHPHFWTGIGISLLFNIVLFFLGMNLFERSLYPSLKKPDVLKAIDIDIYPENCTGILSYESPVFPQILNVFFGKSNQFPGKICYDETS